MKRGEYCAHLRPDYDKLEMAHYITRHPETDEISWEPSSMKEELMRLGLIERDGDGNQNVQGRRGRS